MEFKVQSKEGPRKYSISVYIYVHFLCTLFYAVLNVILNVHRIMMCGSDALQSIYGSCL